MRYYGLDLWSDLTGPRLPWCRLRVLIEQLPEGCALTRSVNGERARWGETDHLLAVVIDLLQAQLWQYASAHARGSRPAPPKPYPRPGVVDPNERRFGTARMTLDEARAWRDRRRKGR